MRRIITKSLEFLSYIVMVLIVLGSAIGGANQAGFLGFIGGLIVGAVMSIVIFGTLFVLMDTADNTRRMAEMMERQGSGSQ
ncbi:MAG: hypothetical protein OEW68_05405 [Gammaproteobacteria bacterium]|nr:hypothetical protein [Gammaproteobacteria bacterium]MDH4314261.1 hypothetical protein [Gammaproteobacteria bacterium]MDH5213646.1 hypothetical protein [Gammaproteobacteria bacterium]